MSKNDRSGDKQHHSMVPGALTRESLTGLRKKKPKSNSGGLPGIAASVRHILKYTHLRSGIKMMRHLNQKGGFDCPGCAWPDPDDERSKLGEFCENGIKAIAEEAQKRTIGASFFARHTVRELSTWSDLKLGKSGRLAEPVVLHPESKNYTPIDWDDAFNLIAEHLNALASPDRAIFYTSGRTSNEAAFLYQLFVRAYGTNNLPDCSNMCHESSGKALSETLGISKGSVTLEDLEKADLLIIMGQNPGTNHPRMLKTLTRCKKNGGRIITVNPIHEAGLIRFTDPQKFGEMLTNGTPLTDHYLPVKVNGDVALLKAVMLKLLKRHEAGEKVFDIDFINGKTEGFDAFIADLKRHTIEQCLDACGLSENELDTAVEMIARAEGVIVCWAMGLTQHVNGVDNVREIVNLLLLLGSIGKPGAGTCPVRGHSNVQGDRTMGIWEAPSQALLDRIEEVYGFRPPQHHGHSTVDAIKAMHRGEASVFVGMGGNFLLATPDTNYTAQALSNCDLTVHVSTKLNRSHLVHGRTALILPCLGRTETDMKSTGEQFVSVENSMGIVHMSKGVLPPCSDKLLSEVEIIARIAQATLGEQPKIPWDTYLESYDAIRDQIAKVIPGFADYNVRVRQPGGFYLPNGARNREFGTPTGRARFTLNKMPDNHLRDGELIMMTIRSHDQFNTTIYGLNDRYRGIYNERRVVFIHPEDAASRGLKDGDLADITSHYNNQVRRAPKFIVVEYDIARGCCATYFPEANVLVPVHHIAHTSKTPASKSVRVRIENAH